ncbi:MAG TPA: hypothetical protein VFV98_13335 [Vicinamibacterales bacterium]|nr:hypothetical protein [Vicinamibacterales bacterium]
MLALALLSALLAVAPAQSLAVTDVNGARVTPLSPAAGDVHLLIFVTPDCPVANRYAPEIDRIAAAYADRRVRTFLIYADASLTPARVKTHLTEFHPSVRATAIIDKGWLLANETGATVTPEAVILTATGRVYRGRIDDWYVALGKSRAAPTSHDLRDALDAVLTGKPVKPGGAAVGCYIERKTP